MTGRELAPHKLARLDQWNAFLDDVVTRTLTHMTERCAMPQGTCVGSVAGDIVDGLTPIEAKMLLEIAIVRLAGLRMTYGSEVIL